MRPRTFKDPHKYQELVSLLNTHVATNGFPTFKSIGRHFHCAHTSIIYQARKIGIPLMREQFLVDLSVNQGKGSYAEYKREEAKRQERKIVFAGLIF